MTGMLHIERAGPMMTLQDAGRPGLIAQGLSVGGAADRVALFEAAALLGLDKPRAAIEMAGTGGVFSVTVATRIALAGAPMRAHVDGVELSWNASHVLFPGQRLTIGGSIRGIYGYLTLASGIEAGHIMGSLSAHLTAGIGKALRADTVVPLGADPNPDEAAKFIPAPDRFSGGKVRLMPGPQSNLFEENTRTRFFSTQFRRGPQANRQGVQLLHEGAPFSTGAAQELASDFIMPGDVQMTGEGEPFVLLCECQTMGGYPRIGTVLPDDLPIIAQAPPNAPIRFAELTLEEADGLFQTDADRLREMRSLTQPLIRDPRYIRDLLSYQLISGVTCGDDLERT